MANRCIPNLIQILPADNISELVDGVNYNFDQILQCGGGVQGEKGEQGEQGLPGATGATGAQGEQGDDGNKWYFTTDTITNDVFTSNPEEHDINNPKAGDYIIDGQGRVYILNDVDTNLFSVQWVFTYDLTTLAVSLSDFFFRAVPQTEYVSDPFRSGTGLALAGSSQSAVFLNTYLEGTSPTFRRLILGSNIDDPVGDPVDGGLGRLTIGVASGDESSTSFLQFIKRSEQYSTLIDPIEESDIAKFQAENRPYNIGAGRSEGGADIPTDSSNFGGYDFRLTTRRGFAADIEEIGENGFEVRGSGGEVFFRTTQNPSASSSNRRGSFAFINNQTPSNTPQASHFTQASSLDFANQTLNSLDPSATNPINYVSNDYQGFGYVSPENARAFIINLNSSILDGILDVYANNGIFRFQYESGEYRIQSTNGNYNLDIGGNSTQLIGGDYLNTTQGNVTTQSQEGNIVIEGLIDTTPASGNITIQTGLTTLNPPADSAKINILANNDLNLTSFNRGVFIGSDPDNTPGTASTINLKSGNTIDFEQFQAFLLRGNVPQINNPSLNNLQVNSSFESEFLFNNNWVNTSNDKITILNDDTVSFSGDYSIKVSYTNDPNFGGIATASIYDRHNKIQLYLNKTLTISARIYYPSTSTLTAALNMSLEIADENGNIDNTGITLNSETTASSNTRDTWLLMSKSFTWDGTGNSERYLRIGSTIFPLNSNILDNISQDLYFIDDVKSTISQQQQRSVLTIDETTKQVHRASSVPVNMGGTGLDSSVNGLLWGDGSNGYGERSYIREDYGGFLSFDRNFTLSQVTFFNATFDTNDAIEENGSVFNRYNFVYGNTLVMLRPDLVGHKIFMQTPFGTTPAEPLRYIAVPFANSNQDFVFQNANNTASSYINRGEIGASNSDYLIESPYNSIIELAGRIKLNILPITWPNDNKSLGDLGQNDVIIIRPKQSLTLTSFDGQELIVTGGNFDFADGNNL